MGTLEIKRNERDWAGQLISWIKDAINQGETVFQDVTNDTSVKMESGRTKFPDILLFIDKISGIVFNGWELKFPDTDVDDYDMLENAIEKAKRIKADSFVTWNGSEAIIWKIDIEHYTVKTLTKLKSYPKTMGINSREDLSNPIKYAANERLLKNRAKEILHDLDQLYRTGQLRSAINVSGNTIDAIRTSARIIVPQFQNAIINEKGINKSFRQEFAKWKIYEDSTLKILEHSSRRNENVQPEQILAKEMFYNLVGKIVFYLTLSENLSGELDRLTISEKCDVKSTLDSCFRNAAKIDYQAIFKPYFTDCINYSDMVDIALSELIKSLSDFDFHILPTNVIGHILENLIPDDEKQKFGQYFTAETLANMVAFPVVKTNNDILFDPTSGTGTFLNSFYNILHYYNKTNHSDLLNQIWGNDISHFPAILSVINLYKQDLTETDNFPRVIRDDFFNLEVGKKVEFPDSHNHKVKEDIPIPLFDGIASNFPFIQQEDIPNEVLSSFFRNRFQEKQRAFLNDNKFSINERSDYFTYCIYNAIRFLKADGCLAAITSNAWLGKEYGFQFKKFLLDNFHIRYVVKSSAEHWFKDSFVSAVFLVLEKENNNSKPTKFVTINFKLEKYFCQDNTNKQLQQIENFYSEIDNCSDNKNTNWVKDSAFKGLYRQKDGLMSVCIVSQNVLLNSISKKESWEQFFISPDLFKSFDKHLINYFPNIIDVFRGERTGWNDMFIIKEKDVPKTNISHKYLEHYIKRPSELKQIKFAGNYEHSLFVCADNLDHLDCGTKKWIQKFQNAQNKNGSKTIQQACQGHKPYWYSLSPKQAHIVTAINPYERIFFSYSETPFAVDQRLVAMKVSNRYDIELIAALLNASLTYLIIEMRGTSRNLGALDLNANYLKNLRFLNPDLLSNNQKADILKAFNPLKNRDVLNITEEIKMQDRIHFDKVVLKSFGLKEELLSSIYSLLTSSITSRVSMNKK